MAKQGATQYKTAEFRENVQMAYLDAASRYSTNEEIASAMQETLRETYKEVTITIEGGKIKIGTGEGAPMDLSEFTTQVEGGLVPNINNTTAPQEGQSNVNTLTLSNLSYEIQNWSYETSTNKQMATVLFSTNEQGITIPTITDGTNFSNTNPVTVESEKEIYIKFSDGQVVSESFNAYTPHWTGSVNFNANAGNDTVTNMPQSPQTKSYGEALAISETPTRTGYTFIGWSENKDATAEGIDVSVGGGYDKNKETTLYAIWTTNNYTVVYNLNGGEGTPPTMQTESYGETVNVSFSPEPTRTG